MTYALLIKKALLPIIAIIILLLCYLDTLQWMIERFTSEDSYYSHGFLIPIITAYLIWTKREKYRNEETEPSKLGFVIIIAAAMMHIMGTILYVYFLSGLSIFLMVFGLVLYLSGWKKTKTILFPLMFLLFMVPFPVALISIVSFPLKMIVAKLGVGLVSLTGIPIHREGFNIFIPSGHLLVGNPCSGLRSLIAFFALGTILAYLSDISKIKKILLSMISVPVAIISNIVRVPILILVSYRWGLKSAEPDTFVHTGSGLLVFLIGYLILMILKKVFFHEKVKGTL